MKRFFAVATLIVLMVLFGPQSLKGQGSATQNLSITVNPAATISSAGAPVLFFTDITSGPATGGENVSGFAGAYVTLYGNNFGSTQGSSTITLNGSNCGRVVSWGTSYFWYQKIVYQLGSSCTTGHFVITVNGLTHTNVNSPSLNGTVYDPSSFTVRSGNIRCVSIGGSDGNPGTFSGGCWANPSTAISNMSAGDITYVENGVSQTSATAFSAVVNIEGNPGGTATNPIAMVVYPGATATIGAINTGLQYAIRVPQIGDSPQYYTIAGFTLRGNEAIDVIAMTGFRIIANDLSCDFATGFGCTHVDSSTLIWQYGNNIHDMGLNCASNSGNPTGAPCKCHATYWTTNTNHGDFAWNITNTTPPGSGLPATGYQWQAFSTGGADQFDLHVHDNLFENSGSGSINLSTVNTASGVVEAYNNVLFHVGTGPGPSGTLSGFFGIGTAESSAHTGNVLVYNNSMYDVGAGGNATNSNACVNATIATLLRNNSCQSTGSGEQYVSTGTSTLDCTKFSGSNNDWFGNGTAPCGTQLTGSLNVNPLYTSTTSGSQNLIPQLSSPLFDAGSISNQSTVDNLGNLRPASIQSPNFPAIGAYDMPQVHGPWYSLFEAADVNSGDLGCYSPSQSAFAANSFTITMIKGSFKCNLANPTTATNNEIYLSSSIMLHDLNFVPTSGNPITFEIKAQLGRGWPAIWTLGGNKAANTGCQTTTPLSWDNFSTCNWSQDTGSAGSNDSGEVDIIEMTESAGYTSPTHNKFVNGNSSACGGPTITDATTNFHVYHMDWALNAIHMQVDGVDQGCNYTSNIPQNPLMILIENRVNPSGAPPTNVFPTTQTVNYVQVCAGLTCTSPGTSLGNTIFLDTFAND